MEVHNDIYKTWKIRFECFLYLYGLLGKVTVPVMGVTKKSNIDGAVKAVELELTQEETDYLEELYVPHALAGVMAQNGKQKAGDVV